MGQRIHCSFSVTGWLTRAALMSPEERQQHCAGLMHEGRQATYEEAVRGMVEELAQGHRVIPFGPPCEGFSYVTGCPGHEIPEEPANPKPDPRESWAAAWESSGRGCGPVVQKRTEVD